MWTVRIAPAELRSLAYAEPVFVLPRLRVREHEILDGLFEGQAGKRLSIDDRINT